MKILLNILGIALSLALCWAISWHRKEIRWQSAARAVLFQFLLALLIVKIPLGRTVISLLSDGITAVINCGNEGLEFVFGDLFGDEIYVFLIAGLGNIIFVSALIGVLYYLGVLGFVVKWVGKAVGRLLGTTEVESFVAVANIFLGHTDSPILVSKYLKDLTDSEIFVVLVSGMGSMSASILGGYYALGIPMEYLLTASALVPIGSILVSKIICPQTEPVKSITDVKMDSREGSSNVIDALAEGANTGMHMVISIAASLVGFLGMVAVVNLLLGVVGLNLSRIFSYVFAPFGFFLGLEGEQILLEGALLGNKLILNEFIAFGDLAAQLGHLEERVGMICAISLCGFANLSSMGMCIGGIGVLCPEKRGTISRLVFRSMLGGVIVSILSAMFVSIAFLI